ncbi:MAG TPA: GNAT family N-acetyltransferase [Tepidisphaeraceae bacterium]|nr:GNAT family N-acetyltransferase [Tepidisphaeraceae bacterium]
MEIRPATVADLNHIADIDGTIESAEYLHVDRTGEGLAPSWKLDPRPLRSKLIESNALDDDRRFTLKQIVTGIEDGTVLVAEHGGSAVAMLLAQHRPERGTMKLVDLRVDYDIRRQGVATVMVYQIMQQARAMELRAVFAETRTSNHPANKFLQKLSFQIAGLDTHRHSNHDMVKESATIFWYAPLD